MTLFVFLLTIYTQGTPDVYVEDSGITGEDCIAAMEKYVAENSNFSKGIPSCEIDMAESLLGHD